MSSARRESEDANVPRALVINGTVGVGKTTVAAAVGQLLTQSRMPNAVIDVDDLRRAWPSPPDDRFNMALAMRNLACVAANHVDAGSVHLVLASVIETPADRSVHERALDMPVVVCRLRARLSVVRDRLLHRHRDDNDALEWHLDRAPELEAILDSSAVNDYSVDVSSGTAAEAAADVLRRAGWHAGG
jgi:adenylylsulfate kinase